MITIQPEVALIILWAVLFGGVLLGYRAGWKDHENHIRITDILNRKGK